MESSLQHLPYSHYAQAATAGKGEEKEENKCLMVKDVSRACMCAPVKQPTYVEICDGVRQRFGLETGGKYCW